MKKTLKLQRRNFFGGIKTKLHVFFLSAFAGFGRQEMADASSSDWQDRAAQRDAPSHARFILQPFLERGGRGQGPPRGDRTYSDKQPERLILHSSWRRDTGSDHGGESGSAFMASPQFYCCVFVLRLRPSSKKFLKHFIRFSGRTPFMCLNLFFPLHCSCRSISMKASFSTTALKASWMVLETLSFQRRHIKKPSAETSRKSSSPPFME